MTTGDFETIKFSLENKIGLLCINRPDKLNALNSKVLSELTELLTSLKSLGPDQIRGLIVTGEGEKAFIAGADIAEMSDMDVDQAKAFGKLGQDVTLLFEQLPIPVIAAVNGFALGGGCEMAMASDFIVATRNALFGQPEVKLGLIPGFGGTQRLAKLIGRNRAKEIIYTGRNVKAEEALRLGLVTDLFDTKDRMLNHARAILGEISKNSPVAIKIAKLAMNEGNDKDVTEGLNIELYQFGAVFGSEDKKEGTKAFVEKRPPVFPGK